VEARRPNVHLPERVAALVDVMAVEDSARP